MSTVNAARSQSALAADGMLDLKALWQAVVRHRLWIIGPTLLAFLLTLVAVHMVTPRYTGEARIILENRDGFFTRPAGDRDSTAERFDSEAVTSQVQVIMSRDLAREAVRRLKLVGNPEFDAGAGLFGSVQQLMVRFGLARNPADRTPEDRVLEKYYENLLVFPVARSRIIVIEFTSKDAELAARAANTIAAVYLDSLEEAKKDSARDASRWLGSAIGPLRERVREAEAKVEAFRANAGLLVGANNTTIIQQQLADLSQQLSNARTIQAESQAKARLIRDAIRTGRTFEIPDVANNDLIRRLIEQRVNLRAQIALESRTLLPEHPRIKELTAQLADLESQIRAAAERTVRTLENEARLAGARVESLTQTIDAQKRAVSEANESEVQLRALEREAKAQREQLEQFLIRQREALARDAENASPADARIVSRAITPLAPSFPKKAPTVAVVTLATLFLALATVISRELLSGRAIAAPVVASAAAHAGNPADPVGDGGQAAHGRPRFSRLGEPSLDPQRPARAPAGPQLVDEEAALQRPGPGLDPRNVRRARVAGLIAHAGRLSHVQLMMDDAGAWHEQIMAAAIRRRPGKGARLLLLDAGTRAGVVRMLGAELAEDDSTVLVDLASLDSGSRPGLSELLSGDAGFAEIIDRDRDSRLHVIAAGRAGRDAVLGAPDLLDMALDALADAYGLVLVSSPSRDIYRDHAVLVPRIDGVLVLADQVSNGHAVETAYRAAEGHDLPVAIAVFHEPDETAGDRVRPAPFGMEPQREATPV